MEREGLPCPPSSTHIGAYVGDLELLTFLNSIRSEENKLTHPPTLTPLMPLGLKLLAAGDPCCEASLVTRGR